MRRLLNPFPLVFGLKHGPPRGDRGSRQQLSRANSRRICGPDVFTIRLRLPMMHVNRVDTGEGYTKFQTFVMCDGTPSCGFSQEARIPVSTATGSERLSTPGTDVV